MDPRLREWHPRILTGLTHDEAGVLHPNAYAIYRDGISDEPIPGGESPGQRHGPAGIWWDAAPREHWPKDPEHLPRLKAEFDGEYGDRRQEIVFIGQNLEPDVWRLRSCASGKRARVATVIEHGAFSVLFRFSAS